MMERLGKAGRRPLVLNRSHTSTPTWGYPTVRELASAPIMQGSHLEGWLIAINHAGVDAVVTNDPRIFAEPAPG